LSGTFEGMAVAGFLTPMLEEPKVPVHRWIALQAELLREAASRGVPAVTAVLRFAGLIPDSLGAVADLDRGLDLDTARLAIAKDHWYPDLADALAHGHDELDTRFEAAADAIHPGDLDTLRRLLDAQPALVRMQSPFPHRQTLLHHIAANGIEVERQLQSPANAVDVLRLLIERGADPDATCDSYGGGAARQRCACSSPPPGQSLRGARPPSSKRCAAVAPKLTASTTTASRRPHLTRSHEDRAG